MKITTRRGVLHEAAEDGSVRTCEGITTTYSGKARISGVRCYLDSAGAIGELCPGDEVRLGAEMRMVTLVDRERLFFEVQGGPPKGPSKTAFWFQRCDADGEN